jgi:FtsZ-interacting cell division protein ZipA
MTLFESTINKLNIPRYVIDDIISIRNICMEAEQQTPAAQQQPPAQPAQPQQPAQQKPAPQQPPQQNATQAQPQQTAAPQQATEQPAKEQPQAQENAQPQQQQQQQNKQDIPQNIEESQVNSGVLMKVFNKFLKDCQGKVTQYLVNKFGQENANNIIKNITPYMNGAEPISFKQVIFPYLLVNGKSNPQDVKDVSEKLKKYFGLEYADAKADTKQQQPAQQQPQEQAQPENKSGN